MHIVTFLVGEFLPDRPDTFLPATFAPPDDLLRTRQEGNYKPVKRLKLRELWLRVRYLLMARSVQLLAFL